MSTPSLYLSFAITLRSTITAMLKPFHNRYPEKFADDNIKNHSVFAGFTPSFFSEIEQFFTEKKMPSGKNFEISKPDAVFFSIIKSGEIHVTETIHQSKEKIEYDLKRGGAIGAPNIFDQNFSSISCRVIETAKILSLSFNDFLNLTTKLSIAPKDTEYQSGYTASSQPGQKSYYATCFFYQ